MPAHLLTNVFNIGLALTILIVVVMFQRQLKAMQKQDEVDGAPSNEDPSYLPDKLWTLAGLFATALFLSIAVTYQEHWAAELTPGFEDAWNQIHKQVSAWAGLFGGWLAVFVFDYTTLRSFRLGEVVRNIPDPGREEVYRPQSEVVRAALILLYGILYGVAGYVGAMAFGI